MAVHTFYLEILIYLICAVCAAPGNPGEGMNMPPSPPPIPQQADPSAPGYYVVPLEFFRKCVEIAFQNATAGSTYPNFLQYIQQNIEDTDSGFFETYRNMFNNRVHATPQPESQRNMALREKVLNAVVGQTEITTSFADMVGSDNPSNVDDVVFAMGEWYPFGFPTNYDNHGPPGPRLALALIDRGGQWNDRAVNNVVHTMESEYYATWDYVTWLSFHTGDERAQVTGFMPRRKDTLVFDWSLKLRTDYHF